MIEKPSLRDLTTEQAIAKIDQWISKTADEINYQLEMIKKEKGDNDGKE